MNVSAVNCTPLKPQVSFGNNEDVSYAQVLNLTKGLNDEFVSSEEIKSPVAALASIGLAGLLAYAGGKGVGNILSKVSKGRIVTGFEGLLKGVSTKAKDFSGKLINQNPGKLNKVKNVAGNTIEKAEGFGRRVYNKLANSGLAENATAADKTKNAFLNAAGWAGVATVFPDICARDTDGDGVKDILQKSQNACTGTETRFDRYLHDASLIAELVANFT